MYDWCTFQLNKPKLGGGSVQSVTELRSTRSIGDSPALPHASIACRPIDNGTVRSGPVPGIQTILLPTCILANFLQRSCGNFCASPR